MKHKLKRIFKRAVPLVLVCTLTIGAVLGHNTKEVKALTGVEEAALVTAILLAYGYVTTRYFNDTDGANALKNDMEQAYEEARFKVLNGGASGGNGDEDPDDNDFEDTDGDGKITEKDIPQFKDISLSGKAAFALSANVTTLLSPIVTKFVSEKFGTPNKNPDINDKLFTLQNTLNDFVSSNNINISSYKYHYRLYNPSNYGNGRIIYEIEDYYFNNGKMLLLNNKEYSLFIFDCIKIETSGGINHKGDVVPYSSRKNNIKDFSAGGYISKFYFWDGPLYNDIDSFNKHGRNYNSNRVDWVTPELQDIFNNQGNLEVLPPYSPNFNYNMPTQQALQELLNNLQSLGLDPIGQKQLVLDYINSLKTEVTPAPDPSPDPKPEPKPEPNPEPNPEPEPSPEPNPEPGENEDNGKFTADLKTLFPFCIPFDLVDCFKLFNAEPETPRIEVPMHFGIIDVDYTWVIDLKDFDSVAVICRSMFLILFLIGLALATSKVIKW